MKKRRYVMPVSQETTLEEFRQQFGRVKKSDLPPSKRRPKRKAKKLKTNLGKLLKAALSSHSQS